MINSGTKTDEDEPQKQCRKRRKKICNDVSHRGWADLPVELLVTIYSTLTIVDFLKFGKVCSSWRLSFSIFKQNFMNVHAPLVMYISSRAKKSCHVYDISTRVKYETKLPTCVGKKFLGSDFALMVLSKTHETIRVYALTNNSRIGVFNLRTRRFWFLTLEGTPWLTTFVRLVASKKQLLIVHFLPTISRAKVYTIDLERLKWVEVEDLGDEALFLGAWMSSNSGSTTNWRGLRNCVYHLPFGSNMCNIYNLNGEFRGRFQICEPDMTHKIYCWYFLHQAYSPDNISDEN
ncbi:hypothetical protein JRO89_XS10G0028200 [Xanthoceras sorbifolium]|uniref:F-box domain-containing protein n=1 Tax=Xanthoceras sorbifolium TaxID=99658 RepID=A0ABQ8HHF0_9ROSI|nr:hypothetical protein JRO89_XS10G0028200 [Xanthoceras sorbifolium]